MTIISEIMDAKPKMTDEEIEAVSIVADEFIKGWRDDKRIILDIGPWNALAVGIVLTAGLKALLEGEG